MSLVDKTDFPIFESHPGLVYLDSAATTQKPEVMIDAVDNFYRCHNANTGRGLYPLAAEADQIYRAARTKVAQFVNSRPEQTIFTSSATASLNLIAYGWGNNIVSSGDMIISTVAEHHSNLIPWQQLAQRQGAKLALLDIDNQGQISLDQLSNYLASSPVRLVSITAVSNVLATINPVNEIVSLCHRHGVPVVIDGSQAVPQMPVSVGEADFYVWGGHKSYGPMGIGVLHVAPQHMSQAEPLLTGGGMVLSVDDQSADFLPGVDGLEAGTQPVAEAHGLAVSLDYLNNIDMVRVRDYEAELTEYLVERLEEVPGIKIYGPEKDRAALVAFSLPYAHPHDISEILGRDSVCVRAGTQCAEPLHRRLGVPATTRVSLGIYNVRQDVDALIASLFKVVRLFG